MLETKEILDAIQKAAETIATPNCAVWLSAVAAIGAVVVAIIVAVRQNNIAGKQTDIAKKQTEIAKIQAEISEQQNKIALFKERYAVYCEIRKIINISGQIVERGKRRKEELFHDIEIIYNIKFTNQEGILQWVAMLSQIKRSEYIIMQSTFLFPTVDEKDIVGLIEVWIEYMAYLLNDRTKRYVDPEAEREKLFVEECDKFFDKYGDLIEEQLNLK